MDTRSPSNLEEWNAAVREEIKHATDAAAVDRSENVAGVVALCVIGVLVTVGAAVLLLM